MKLLQLFERNGSRESEFPGARTTQLREVGSAAEGLAKVVGERADVGSGGNFGNEAGAISPDALDFKTKNFNLDGFQLDWFVLAGEFVGGDTVDFLGRVGGRGLQDASGEGRQMALNVSEGGMGAGDWADGLTLGIIGIG